MKTQMNKNEIIIRHKNGDSIRKIAREMGISRNTVRSYIRKYDENIEKLNKETDKFVVAALQDELCAPPKRKSAKRNKTAFTAEVEKRFNEIIEISKRKDELLGNNKQTLTAVKIYNVLKEEGYKIGLTTICTKYREYKNKHRECFIRQEYDYGFRVEFDFHQVKVLIAGKKVTYHQVTIVAPKSNYIFELLYPNEKQNVVIDSIIKFINFCDGVFKEFTFDNMSTLVKRLCRDGKIYSEEIIKLSNYYGFKIVTCNPRSGNEKGSVENGGKYTRNDFFSLDFEFDSEEELFYYHKKKLEEYNKRYLDEWKKEKAALMKKPANDYIIQTTSNNIVNSYSCVCVLNNYYSVPDKYVGETVEVNILADYILIHTKDNLTIKHEKIKGFHEYKIVLEHYIDTFKKKPHALPHSLALKQAPNELRNIYNKHYSTDPKRFIEDLYGNKLIKTENIKDEIEEISSNQLEEIDRIFIH